MVKDDREAILEYTGLRARSGMDDLVCHDGRCRMARLEACRIQGRQDAPDIICCATCTKRRLVVGFLSLPPTRLGLCGDCGSMAGNHGNNIRVLQKLEDRWLVDGAVCYVGELCERAELCDLAVEFPLTYDGVVLSLDSHSSERFIHGIKVPMVHQYVDKLIRFVNFTL
jgi:hypothetical protein|tara:strand:- start:644 stop:1150 length:507 start_codon:yes stop_codon:yes gene_type:complete